MSVCILALWQKKRRHHDSRPAHRDLSGAYLQLALKKAARFAWTISVLRSTVLRGVLGGWIRTALYRRYAGTLGRNHSGVVQNAEACWRL